ncbi:MAG TPA: UDP-N-acetylglucosamine 2-epimerase [Croceibacterium sp.]|nr:UDP-N-acetylglucosamine 2-epimerase [Croceibacterium sp.]
MSRRVCIVTGTRAEYGLLREVVRGVRDAAELKLQLVVTGMHLSPEFGFTIAEIEADGIPIAERVEMLLSSDSAVGVTKSTGIGLIGFADSFARLQPDLVVLLGDRFEILAAASAALFARIPIAHIHGGETTEGAFDEAIRHSVTKMSHLHFVTAEPYRRRVIQLGEAPERVFTVGSLGAEAARNLALLDRHALEDSLGFGLGERNLLVTFHPPTLDETDAARQMQAMLEALGALGDHTHIFFTMPNADTRGRELGAMVERFVDGRANARAYQSLGQLRYLSLMALVDGVVGNSSSGVIEAPAFGVPTVNIGDRQAGRLRAPTIVDCAPHREAIAAALEKILSSEFRNAATRDSSHGTGGAAAAIVRKLREHPLDGLVKKRFHDLPRDGVNASGSSEGL